MNVRSETLKIFQEIGNFKLVWHGARVGLNERGKECEKAGPKTIWNSSLYAYATQLHLQATLNSVSMCIQNYSVISSIR